jgi:alkanesulfonate monooxygenase SsuD/methylene tetrahydromethanopterin reductase-like flavin-dependent oxidoreductase (luciferase family)
MKLGLHLSQDAMGYEKIKDITLRAERAGIDSLWILDHLHASPRPDKEDMLECWTVLSALSAETEEIKFGPLVLNVNNRNPALLAKMASTLDHINKGRLLFGIGAGGLNRAGRQKALGYEYEFDAYGISFPLKASERIRKLDEALEIIKKMWTEDKASFKGKYYTLKDAYCKPKPYQSPHPPIWIGSRGGPKMMKVIAKHADGWDYSGASNIEDYDSGIKKLRESCRKIGRDAGDIEISMRITGSIEECRQKIDTFDEAGVDLGILRVPKGEELVYLQDLEGAL